jgi:hypothetical protein
MLLAKYVLHVFQGMNMSGGGMPGGTTQVKEQLPLEWEKETKIKL